MNQQERNARIEDAARTITRMRDFMRGSGITKRGADRVVDIILEAAHDAVEGCTMMEDAGAVLLQVARACGAAVPGKNEDYQEYEEE